MKWKTSNEVTEPGNYLFGCLSVSKYYHKIEIVRSIQNEDELAIRANGHETPKRLWDKDMRFFGPIPAIDDGEELRPSFDLAEHRVSHAENTPGYSDFEYVEKVLLRLRPLVQNDKFYKEKWSNLVARLNKLRYG